MRKPIICICKNKDVFVFTTHIVQLLYFLKPKFPASSLLLWLYRMVCVGPVRKPHSGFLELWLLSYSCKIDFFPVEHVIYTHTVVYSELCVVIFDTGVCIVVVYGTHASKNVILLTKFSIFVILLYFCNFLGSTLMFDEF